MGGGSGAAVSAASGRDLQSLQKGKGGEAMNITTKTITTVQLSMEEIKEALTEYLMCRGVAGEEETTTVQFRSRQRRGTSGTLSGLL